MMQADDATAQAAALEAQFGISGKIAFTTMYGGPVAILQHEGARAIVALQGAHVLSYETQTCGEILWLSPHAKLGTGKAVRGGIPICWPWFGPHPTDNKRPAHGFVRTRDFAVHAALASDALTQLFLTFETTDQTAELWPHHANLSLHLTLASDGLTLALRTSNMGRSGFQLTQALHTYLRVGDIDAVTVEGLQGRPFIDQIDQHRTRLEDASLTIAQEVDRIYQNTKDTVLVRDRALGRVMRVDKSGSSATVVWNPWIEKSARLGDLGENGWRHMVCVETANAGADIVTLDQGAQHILQARISSFRD